MVLGACAASWKRICCDPVWPLLLIFTDGRRLTKALATTLRQTRSLWSVLGADDALFSASSFRGRGAFI